jgi:transcriptional regulator with GAF, ATPase, and Fis domain
MRYNRPFIAVNCAAIPKELMESELFGFDKGAFTGAASDKAGKFEAAAEGTVFLDEIGELELTVQAKLLRVLQEREVERLGTNKKVKVNFRLISSTNRDLQKEVDAAGSGGPLLPDKRDTDKRSALRERMQDILLLAGELLMTFGAGEQAVRPLR